MILPHSSEGLPVQRLASSDPRSPESTEGQGRAFLSPQRLPGKAGSSAGQSRGNMLPQPRNQTREAGELLGRSPCSCPCVSWLPLPLSLPPCLPLLRSRACTPDCANLHHGKGRGEAATAHKTHLSPGFTAPSVPGKQEATQPQTLRLQNQLLPPGSLQPGWINRPEGTSGPHMPAP